MFTGLIETRGRIETLTQTDGSMRLTVAAPTLGSRLKEGDSIAVNGVCLTALAPSTEGFAAELAAETIARTSLSKLVAGTEVNLELPTPAGTPLGGHIVQGHVDATGELLGLEPVSQGERTDWLLRIAVPPAVGRFVVEKGSVTIEGISLTVAKWFPERDAQDDTLTGAGELHVAVIPHTYEVTNLHTLQPGSPVNLEADVLMKLAVQNGWKPGAETQWSQVAERDAAHDAPFTLTHAFLIENGY
jgi:riboflavin synthase